MMSDLPNRVQAVFESKEIKRLQKHDGVWGTWIMAALLLLPGTLLSLVLPLKGELFLTLGLLILLSTALLMARLSGKKERRIFDAEMKKMGYSADEIDAMWHKKKDEEEHADH